MSNDLIKKAKTLEGRITVGELPKLVLDNKYVTDDYIYTNKVTGRINMTDEFAVRLFTLSASGVPVREIGRILNIKSEGILHIMNSINYKAIAQLMTKDIVDYARMNMMTASIKAVEKIIELVSSDDEKIALRASVEILNRVGLDTPKKLEIKTEKKIIHELDEEQLSAILKAGQLAMDYKDSGGELVDVEYQEIYPDELIVEEVEPSDE